MGKFKSLGLLVFALVLAASAMLAAMRYLEQREREMHAAFEASANYIDILVPAGSLRVGDSITAESVAVRRVPAQYIPDGALMSTDFRLVAGMLVKEPVTEGRPLLRSALEGLSAVEKFSQLLSQGQRAVTLDVGRLDTAENMLVAGDYIDLLLMSPASAGQSGLTSSVPELLLERALVLATGVRTIANPTFGHGTVDEGYSTLTLGVEPEDAARILGLKDRGRFAYLLRHPEDKGRLRFNAVSRADIGTVEVYAGGMATAGMLQKNRSRDANGSLRPMTGLATDKRAQKYSRLTGPDAGDAESAASSSRQRTSEGPKGI